MKNKLSVVLATRNEEVNIGRCLAAVKDIAEEIIIFDEYSTDKTESIAKSYGAKVFKEPHHDNFHITKQKAITKATGDWILQLDADEVITPALASEIKEVIQMSDTEILARKMPEGKRRLFEKHMRVIEERDGKIGKESGEVAAFFIPRLNMFLGKSLTRAGVYPDPAIRLIKKGKAYLPAKSVHEIMQIDGQLAWLFNDMEHYDSPTFSRYLARLNRYTDLHAQDLKEAKVGKNILNFLHYSFTEPAANFFKLYILNKGFLDGMNGFIWSLFSSLHFPIAYYKYWQMK